MLPDGNPYQGAVKGECLVLFGSTSVMSALGNESKGTWCEERMVIATTVTGKQNLLFIALLRIQ